MRGFCKSQYAGSSPVPSPNPPLARVVDNFQMTQDSATPLHPLVVRFAAFGDVVMLTALIESLSRRYGAPVDLLSSGPWTPELLRHDTSVRDIQLVTSRKTPYWLCPSQWRAVRWMASRRNVPVYLCDPEPKALALLLRAGIPRDNILRTWDTWPGNQAHWVDWWNDVARQTPAAFSESAPPPLEHNATPRLVVTDGERILDIAGPVSARLEGLALRIAFPAHAAAVDLHAQLRGNPFGDVFGLVVPAAAALDGM